MEKRILSNTNVAVWRQVKRENSSSHEKEYVAIKKKITIDLFTDTAAILISIVSNSYYGMLRGQVHVHINLPPEHPIMSSETMDRFHVTSSFSKIQN